jgi:hypothetical protein
VPREAAQPTHFWPAAPPLRADIPQLLFCGVNYQRTVRYCVAIATEFRSIRLVPPSKSR